MEAVSAQRIEGGLRREDVGLWLGGLGVVEVLRKRCRQHRLDLPECRGCGDREWSQVGQRSRIVPGINERDVENGRVKSCKD